MQQLPRDTSYCLRLAITRNPCIRSWTEGAFSHKLRSFTWERDTTKIHLNALTWMHGRTYVNLLGCIPKVLHLIIDDHGGNNLAQGKQGMALLHGNLSDNEGNLLSQHVWMFHWFFWWLASSGGLLPVMIGLIADCILLCRILCNLY